MDEPPPPHPTNKLTAKVGIKDKYKGFMVYTASV
jgi:hypothetical protein